MSVPMWTLPRVESALQWKRANLRDVRAKRRSFFREKKIGEGSKVRTVYAVRDPLRELHRSIIKRILRKQQFPEGMHGCVPGHSLRDNASPHAFRRHLFRIDIKSFFPSVTERQIRSALVREARFASDAAKLVAGLCCHNGRLPQGAATSPALANLVMARPFRAIRDQGLGAGVEVTVWVDDLVFSGRRGGVSDVVSFAYRALLGEGLPINREKSGWIHHSADNPAIVTGAEVAEGVAAPREFVRRLEEHASELAWIIAELGEPPDDYDSWLRRLQGHVGHIRGLNREQATAVTARISALLMGWVVVENGMLRGGRGREF